MFKLKKLLTCTQGQLVKKERKSNMYLLWIARLKAKSDN